MLNKIFSSNRISNSGMTTNSKIKYKRTIEVAVHITKNFVWGIVLIKNLKTEARITKTAVNEKIVHHKLIEANRNIKGKINTGRRVSQEICLAPPRQGMRNLSCMVAITRDLLRSGKPWPVIKLQKIGVLLWNTFDNYYLSKPSSKSTQLQQQAKMWLRSLLLSKYSQQHKGVKLSSIPFHNNYNVVEIFLW